MKVRSLLILLFSLNVIGMFAQNGYPAYGPPKVSRWTFGIKTGVNISDISNYPLNIRTESKTGFHFGFTGDYILSDNIYFQPSIVLSGKGIKGDYIVPKEDYRPEYACKKTVNLYYLELPLLLAYKIPVTDKFKLELQAGPTISIGVFGKTKDEALGQEMFSSDSFQKKFGFERTDFGLAGGVTAELYKHYRIGVAYTKGLSSLQEQIGNKEDPKNTNIAFSLSYMF